MWTIHKEIRTVARQIGLGSDRFRRLDEHREHKVLQDVKRHFLADARTASWWECFRYASDSRRLRQPHLLLPELCPNEGKKVWFVPIGEQEGVYDALPEAASRLIHACPFIPAYAVADKKLGWMFVENPRHLMFATGAAALSRLDAISE
ncbi:MAG: DUF6756 family protein [Thermodesulfobacteriota bacterium]